MFRFVRAACGRVPPLLCALSLALPLPAAAASNGWRDAQTLPALVAALDDWLDNHSPWPRRETAPGIRMVSLARAYAVSGQAMREGRHPRGFYDKETRIIYLVRPWNPRSAQDASVLLHELAHHRQVTARHWYCDGAMELPAYRTQAAWLAEQGASIDINWIAAVMEGSCRPRDFHPD